MFCTYLTIIEYEDKKYRYIGSSSVKKIEDGYNGSFCSNKWKDIYVNGKKHTRILSRWVNREDALSEELRLHLLYDVVKSDNYIKESLANPNGFFGRDVSGENNPMFGKIRTGEKRSDEAKKNISDGLKRFFNSERGNNEKKKRSIDMIGENNPMFGKKHSEETRSKISEASKGRPAHNKGKPMSEEQKIKMRAPKSEEHKQALRKTYVVDGKVIKNAKQFCISSGYNYSCFTQAAKHKKMYKGMTIEVLDK